MTRTSDLEATMEQHKVEVAATMAANAKRLDQMQEMIEKNKAETDKQHAEVLQLLKALQPPTTTTAAASQSTIPPPPTAAIPSTFPTTIPLPLPSRHTFSMPPPTHPLTLPIITQPSAAYTSFSGLRFDSQGCPIPTSPPNDFIGPFSTWEDHGFHNRRPSVSTESTFQNFPDYSRGVSNGRFSGQLPPIPPNNGYERGWGSGADFRLRKLEMPLFEGDDVFGWVYRIERFFDIQRVMTSGERLRAAVLCLEGPALAWFRWTDNRTPFRSWEELKSRMLDRFQPSQEGSLYEQFLNISQEGSARDYVALFEKMAAQLEGIQEEILEGTFIKGLKPDLRTAVRTQQPKGLTQAIKLALLIDENRSEKVPNSRPVGRMGGGVPRSSVVPTGEQTRK